jgi:hypothetical protein
MRTLKGVDYVSRVFDGHLSVGRSARADTASAAAAAASRPNQRIEAAGIELLPLPL